MTFGRSALVVASNRGPVTITVNDDGDERFRRGSGGLVTGMQAALNDEAGAVWVCAAMNGTERTVARRTGGRRWSESEDAAADSVSGSFDIVMLGIDEHTFRQAYDGIANTTLWFTLHMLFEPSNRPAFDSSWRRQWLAYRRVNQAFADAIAREAAEGAVVMVQDYHLFLVPGLLRAARPDLRVGLFTHTPWVSSEYFRILPDDVSVEILESMAAATVLGFHTRRWAALFDECCTAVLGRAAEAEVGVFGLTIDVGEISARAARKDVSAAAAELQDAIGDRIVIGRVDRTELSKNVLRGLMAYRELLRRWPEWRGRVVHVVSDFPSRGNIRQYRDYIDQVEDLGREIDDEFATTTWQPLVMSTEVDYAEALATLRLSDVLFVNSVRDGMNLVILEGIALAEHDPAVVLSRETGAAELLGDAALLVNPFDVSQSAEALREALTMPADERARRAAAMRATLGESNPVEWFRAQVTAVRG